jgi:UDP:flavonoid glycosyltransferase YjiC (YdhE family)
MKHQPKPLLLIFPFGFLSHYLRCLVLARHLSPYFKIKFAAHDKYSGFVTSEGFTTFDVEDTNEEDILDHVKDFDFSWLSEQYLELTFLSQEAAIKKHKPAAVLGDAVASLKMAAESCGVPFVSVCNAYMTKYYTGERSLPKAHYAHPYLDKLSPVFRKFALHTGEQLAFRKVHKPFLKLRKKYGLKLTKNYLDEWEGDHTIVCDLPALFPLKELPHNFTCTGPLIYTGHSGTGGAPLAGPDPGKKTIYVSMGSTGNWEQARFLNDTFYSKYNIVAAGDAGGVLNAPHIISVDFISAGTILPYTDLVICHGGNGTLYQALAYGVPLLCSAAHFEQEWNVAALKKNGLAASLDGITDHRPLLDEWANRKHLQLYTATKVAITNSQLLLGDRIEKIATGVLNNETAPVAELAERKRQRIKN